MEWVEAHQDTKHLTRNLSEPAKLNCITDKDNGAYMASTHVPLATPPVLLSTVAILTVKGVVVTNKLQETLRNAANCSDTQDYICKKTRWLIDEFGKIQWQALGSVFESLTLPNKIRSLKFQHNWLPTGIRKKKWDLTALAICPICADKEEDWEHLFKCKHDSACTSRDHINGAVWTPTHHACLVILLEHYSQRLHKNNKTSVGTI
eukprot:9782886-Ditylum_brightwellii.AAC.1